MAGITTQENFYKVEQNNLLSEENPGEAKLLLLVSLKKKKKTLRGLSWTETCFY